MTWPAASNRHCCPACREPIADPAPVSQLEAESLRLTYEASRRTYTKANPPLTREQMAARK